MKRDSATILWTGVTFCGCESDTWPSRMCKRVLVASTSRMREKESELWLPCGHVISVYDVDERVELSAIECELLSFRRWWVVLLMRVSCHLFGGVSWWRGVSCHLFGGEFVTRSELTLLLGGERLSFRRGGESPFSWSQVNWVAGGGEWLKTWELSVR